jgi:hypothetical protein
LRGSVLPADRLGQGCTIVTDAGAGLRAGGGAGILMVIILAVDRRRGRRSSGVDLVKLNDRRATNVPCPSSHPFSAANAAGYSRLMEADESDTLRMLRVIQDVQTGRVGDALDGPT